MPTLVDLVKLEQPKGKALDGLSLKGVIEGNEDALPERTIFAATQRQFVPPKWQRSVAMHGKWRLVDGKALYDWHPLISGTVDSVHEAGVSMQNRTLPEFEVHEDDWEDHIIEEPL